MILSDTSLPQAIYDFAVGTSAEYGGGVDCDSILLASYLLEQQEDLEISGSMCEIGVKEGRFLAILAHYSRQPGRLVGVDPFYGVEELKSAPIENIAARVPNGVALRMLYESSHRVEPSQLLDEADGRLRFVHIDGNHEEDFVCHDLRLAAETVCDGAIVACDDYFHYSGIGVSAALFQIFAREHNVSLVPLAACGPKFYLTTQSHLQVYRERMLTRFDRDNRPVIDTTWLGRPLISVHLTGKYAARAQKHAELRVAAGKGDRGLSSWGEPAIERPPATRKSG